MKFIICLQFWEKDKVTAMRLARFIADLERVFRVDTEFLFVARYDCEHDHDTIRYVNEKFRVNWITSHTKWTGWPGGPNAMARDTLEWLDANRSRSGGALLFEPDCVPTRTDWIDVLIQEWDRGRFAEKILMGAWRPSGGADGHINGNCVLRPNFLRHVGIDCFIPDLAWDCAISPYVKNRWLKSDRIRNCFESLNATDKDVFWTPIGQDTPALVHGFKDDSAYNLVQRLLHHDTSELSL